MSKAAGQCIKEHQKIEEKKQTWSLKTVDKFFLEE